MRPEKTIGFDRKIDLAWMDAVAGRVSVGSSPEETRAYLKALLGPVVAGESPRDAIGKTLTTLMHIWVVVPEQALALRNEAVSILPQSDQTERLAAHWAMAMATYPFFADVAAAVGRLIGLQGYVNLVQLTRRLAESWGDRSTMHRAAQRVVRSMVEWGALRDAPTRGTYLPPVASPSVTDGVAMLLVNALLLSTEGNRMPVNDILSHPATFPFRIDVSMTQLRQRFRVSREGVDVVELIS